MSLIDLLGIEYPILQSGMGGVAGSALAAAVSNAGGLGILAGHGIEPEELIQELGRLKALTDRSFGVNLLLAEDLVSPAEPATRVAEDVNAKLNPLRREIDLPAQQGLPKEPSRRIPEKLEILIEARIPVLSIGLGNPGHELVERCHREGIRVIAMVATVEDALTVEAAGVDAVVVQGAEAGGHRSHFQKPDDKGFGLVGSMVLIPEVVDSVKIPVIAAGGISDGRGLVAAIALGAEAVMMGTRFVATRESLADAAFKEAVLKGRSGDTTVTDAASGRYARLLRNRFTEEYGDGPTLPFGWQASATAELFERAREIGDNQHVALWAGQASGRIHEELGAAEVIKNIVREAEETRTRAASAR